jgi:HEAT repeat protein
VLLGSPEERLAAVRALGEFRSLRYVEPLRTALKDAFPPIRQAAAESLKRLGLDPEVQN